MCFDEVGRWLADDMPHIDVGGFVVGDHIETAKLLCKSSGVLAGVPFAEAVMKLCHLEYEWIIEEGTYIDITTSSNHKVIVAIVKGACKNILLAERTILNILSRASGVATQAHRAVSIAQSYNWHGHVAGTRKTTPGFKMVEKYALLVGGAATHRMDISHMVMLRRNNILTTISYITL
jgi:nicotinate-nucleotide pyrophosphorylase (carboxylating)